MVSERLSKLRHGRVTKIIMIIPACAVRSKLPKRHRALEGVSVFILLQRINSILAGWREGWEGEDTFCPEIITHAVLNAHLFLLSASPPSPPTLSYITFTHLLNLHAGPSFQILPSNSTWATSKYVARPVSLPRSSPFPQTGPSSPTLFSYIPSNVT